MAWTPTTSTPRPSSNCTVGTSWCRYCGLQWDNSVFTGFLLVFWNADSNGDGFFDEQELEALFTKEVRLVLNVWNWNERWLNVGLCNYSWRKSMTPITKRTIWSRWRKRDYVCGSMLWTRSEHAHLHILPRPCCRVMSQLLSPSQVDTNKDRLVSLEEFLVATRKKEFLEPDSWEVMWHRNVDHAEEKQNFFCWNRSPHLLCFFRRWSRIQFIQTRRWESSRSTSLSRSRTWTWGLPTSRNRETIWSDNRPSSTPRRLSYNR